MTPQLTITELQDHVPAGNLSISGEGQVWGVQTSTLSLTLPLLWAAKSCYLSCLLCPMRRSFWSLETEPALCYVNPCQKCKTFLISLIWLLFVTEVQADWRSQDSTIILKKLSVGSERFSSGRVREGERERGKPEPPPCIHMNACFCKHVSQQTHKHTLSSACTAMPHWTLQRHALYKIHTKNQIDLWCFAAMFYFTFPRPSLCSACTIQSALITPSWILACIAACVLDPLICSASNNVFFIMCR